MNFKRNLKKGMEIKICDDPIKSIRQYSGSTRKREMAGTIQKIHRVSSSFIIVNYRGDNWTIVNDDFSVISEETKIKPELFNPENLFL